MIYTFAYISCFRGVFSGMGWKELLNNFARDLFTTLLVLSNEFLKDFDQDLFDLTCQHFTSTVFLSDFF